MAVWSTSASDCSSVCLLFFTLLLVVGTAVLAAPLQQQQQQQSNQDPWWYNPCTSPLPKIRHSRSTGDPAKMQCDLFEMKLNKSIKQINRLYGITTSHTTSHKLGKLRWLNPKKMHKKLLRKDKKAYFKQLNRQLQYYAGTLDVLRRAKVTTDISFKPKKRERIYKTTTEYLKACMCEVQDSLINTQPARMTLKKMKIPVDGLRKLDNTKAHLIDVAFFSKMRQYFVGLKEISEQMSERT